MIILLVVAIFGFLVFIHELGHFLAARRAGIEVHEFGFGFPPRLIGKKIGNTIYSINWLPLGGFVRLKGEEGGTPAGGSKGSFAAATLGTKTQVLLAGVVMNLVAAYLIILALCFTGLPPLLPNQDKIGHPTYAQARQVLILNVTAGSPADLTGIKKGDVVLSGNGLAFHSEDELLSFTKAHAGQTVDFEVKSQKSEVKSLTIRLLGPEHDGGYLGVMPLLTYKLRYGWDSFVVALRLMFVMVGSTFAAFIGLLVGLFAHAKVSGEVTGPVGIVVLLSNIIHLGWAYVLMFVASISTSLGVINVLPLPALDGGRLLMVLIQRYKRIPEQLESWINNIGFGLLIVLMIIITVVDIQRFR